jgi:RNA polymerase sigma-70 factor (ECF subfamily)
VAEPSDAELCAGLRRGDPIALDRVYARYRARIYGFVLRLAGDRHLADDLFQETWMKLARHATRLAEDTDLAAWLFTVARNGHRSYGRAETRNAARLERLSLVEGASAASRPDVQVDMAERMGTLERALLALSTSDREVLLLVGVEGLSQDQVAAILGIQHAAVRQRLSRARARLADKLEELEAPRLAARKVMQ